MFRGPPTPQSSLRRINLSEFLCDGDNLHLGEISRSKLRSSLGRAGILLKPAELELLEHSFAHKERPDKVNWKAFFAQLLVTPLPPEAQLDIVGQVSVGWGERLRRRQERLRYPEGEWPG